ncbi:phytanoyl-CoA dioxygenase family protein [Paenibacillus koleovorans]|uniref:phytanoyl-CoA dioxygenase family protein n=1 Tax=Paenibacillus koleovorans TaxID=121608 RepID=UPI0013E32E6B|nr:phytanoyl-CoA dioxygenase family protein [Paenibacillus koleovorans]
MLQSKSAYDQFFEEGYIFFPQVFKGEELSRLRAACNYVLEQFTEEHDRLNPNIDFNSFRHLNDTRWHREGREHYKTIMETIADPRCLGPVEQIFAGPSLFRSTSYFVNQRFGSKNGNWHRDSQFVTKDEQEEQEMLSKQWKEKIVLGLQFQIALIDNDDVEYVPYSGNRYDSPEERYIRLSDNKTHNDEDGMPNALRVPLKAGDAVIFNPNGLHRGRYHKEIPRRTLMLTYTPLDMKTYDYYSNQPWLEGPGALDGLSLRAVAYFTQFIDAYRDFWRTSKESAGN